MTSAASARIGLRGGCAPRRRAAGATASLPRPAAAEEKVLNVYNWTDYIGETTIADFEARTGIKVSYDTYDSNEILETKMLTGRTGYDLVVPSAIPRNGRSRRASPGTRQGPAAQPCQHGPGDHARIALNDPGNAHAINYMWGTVGIGYNPALVTEGARHRSHRQLERRVRSSGRIEAREVRHCVAERTGRPVHGRPDLPRP